MNFRMNVNLKVKFHGCNQFYEIFIMFSNLFIYLLKREKDNDPIFCQKALNKFQQTTSAKPYVE